MQLTDKAAQEKARLHLETIIARGKKAGPVIEHVLNTIPDDRIVHSKASRVVVNQDGSLAFNDAPMHQHATGQLVERLGIPTGYANELRITPARKRPEDFQWRRDLLQHTIAETLSHTDSRFLVRAQGGQIRGVLSDRFRRLDSRPLLDAFCGACDAIGAIPVEGIATDLRASVRAIIPEIHEPIPGEYMVFGLSWTNSDFGAGLYGISAYAERLLCFNGMVGQSAMRQVHLGGRLPDDLELSASTYRLDTQTMASATKDVVKGTLGPAAIEGRMRAIQNAATGEVSSAEMLRKVGKLLGKEETAEVKRAFEGAETLMLPAGKTAWRFSNALSWVANNTHDPERRLELQAAAGIIAA